MATAQRILGIFRRFEGKPTFWSYIWRIVELPVNFVRDFTVPMAEESEWNKLRAIVLPLTIPFSFILLSGVYDFDYDEAGLQSSVVVCLWLLIPGVICSLAIYKFAPSDEFNKYLNFIFALIAFV